MDGTTQVLYQSSLQNVEKGRKNHSFASATLRLLAVDTVANQTKYSKEAVLKALPTLRNIPIVGKLKGDNFGSHESQMVLDEEVGLKVVYNTTPIGLIPESANFWFEMVEVGGKPQEFLCVDVLLWKRQKEVNVLLNQKQFGTSMEVTILNGKKDRSGVLHIEDFYFTAVCVLGHHITPAFNGAQIQVYAENIDIQDQINQMMLEFAKQLGGESVPAENKKVSEDKKEKENVETTDVKETDVEETKAEDQTISESDSVEETAEPNDDSQPKDEKEEDKDEEEKTFACQPKDEEEKTCEADPQEKEQPTDEDPQSKDEEENEEESELDRLKADYQNVVDALSVKSSEIETLQTTIDALKSENETLKEFKASVLAERRQQAEEELFSRFEELKSLPEFENLKTQAGQYTIEALETQLYALIGRKCHAQKQYSNPVNVAYEATYQASTPTDSIFGLLDGYLKK